MPIQYERDDARRVVVVTIEGELPVMEELLQLFERHRAEDVWHYGVLYDLLHMTGRPSYAYLRDLKAKSTSAAPTDRLRGPVAMVTRDPILYTAACTYAALISKRKIRIFRDVDEAGLWLAEETDPAP